MKRRTLLLASSSLLALETHAMPSPSAAQPDLLETSAATMAQAMQRGQTTAEALVRASSAWA